jgi:hypothetical protein
MGVVEVKQGVLIKGLGLSTNKIDPKTDKVYFEYEYPEGTEVLLKLDGIYFVIYQHRIIATFSNSDVFDYVKINVGV